MFRELMKFSYKRTPLQAFGWYLIFSLIGGVLVSFILVLIDHTPLTPMGTPFEARTLQEAFERGLHFNQLWIHVPNAV